MSDAVHIYSQSPDLDTMGGRLSRARDSSGLSVSELARRLGVKDSTIQAWESDRSMPRANRLAMLAGLLNVSPSWILHGIGTAPSEESQVEMVGEISEKLKHLRRMHEETARIIGQIERDLARASSAS